jgi:RNA polymerase sigma-70 factor, ECF subfamily
VLGPARLDVAEEAVQEAMVRALQRWPYAGVPDNPAGWLFQVARNCAVDLVRHDDVVRAKLPLLVMDGTGTREHEDDELALMFLCCHPGLPLASQVVLTLKTVGGLGVGEIGAALLSRPATVAQRLVRAKRWLRDNTVPLEVDVSRVDSVLAVLYLLFNAGYDAVDGDSAVRGELCGEAIRLARLLAELMPGRPEVLGLLALMLLHDARRGARVDEHGVFVPLDRQDRSRWDQGRVREGVRALERALAQRRPGPCQLQAAIAAVHARSPDWEQTDWARIAEYYEALGRVAPSPVVEVNRAVAVGYAQGPAAGLDLLEPLVQADTLAGYQPLHAAHAELLRRAGDRDGAADAYRRGIELSTNDVERAELERRLATL